MKTGGRDQRRDSYSRVIRVLRIVLPVVAIALLISIFALSKTSSLRRGLVLPDAQLSSLVTGQKITNPQFSGVTNSGDAFLMLADSALPDAPRPRHVDLDRPRTTIDFDSGLQLKSISQTGKFDLKENFAQMTDDVHITTSSGWEAFSDLLTLNYKTGNAHSPGKVFATGPFGTVEADEMRLVQDLDQNPRGGQGVIHFKNNVKVIYRPKQED